MVSDDEVVKGLPMRILLSVLSVVLLPLTASAQDVTVDWDKGADFSEYETFVWREGTPVPNDLSDHRITSAVENELGIKGYWLNEEEPDLYLVYYASAKEEVDLGGAGYRQTWTSPGTIKVDKYLAGTLVLDILDAKKGRLLWRGIARGTVSPTPRKNQTIIHKAVTKLLEGFPP